MSVNILLIIVAVISFLGLILSGIAINVMRSYKYESRETKMAKEIETLRKNNGYYS